MEQDDRVILLLDADYFEVQVYQKHDSNWKGKPCVVTNSSGRIIAVNNEAKPFGISRDDGTYQKAKLKCASLANIKIPERTDNPGHPNYKIQAQATNEIVNEIKGFCNDQTVTRPIFQYSCRDEFYLDVTTLVDTIIKTQGTNFPTNLGRNVWGKSIVETPNGPMSATEWKSDKLYEIKLFYGLVIGSVLVQRIKTNTGFQTSVGIGGNKLIAKLGCGLNKPGAITLVLPYALSQIGHRIKLSDVPGLGGRLGEAILESLDVKTMYDLTNYRVEEIAKVAVPGAGSGIIGQKKAQDFYNFVHGICDEKVVEKAGPSSIKTSAQFNGAKYSFTQLIDEIRLLIKTFLQRADEEFEWRQRIPMSLKLSIKRHAKNTLSVRLDYAVDVQNADEILDMFIEHLRLDDEWDEVGEQLNKLEIQAQQFSSTTDNKNVNPNYCYI